MLIHQFEAKGLSHFSYAVGCKDGGEVAIIDPKRDIRSYIEFAAEHRLKIKYVIETHIHADYASGASALAEKTGAELLLSSYDEGEKYSYNFPHTELKDQDVIHIGNCGKLRVLHTPGHTPEHISFLFYDPDQNSEEPVALFSGDWLFAGSVGRPDLLGEADKEPLARQMYRSLREKLSNIPDSVVVYPGHGAGSLCGAGMSNSTSTTLAEEREKNPYLKKDISEEDFVQQLLNSAPVMPPYYLRMKELNSIGATALDKMPRPQPIKAEEFAEHCNDFVLDLRHPLAFGGGHIDGSINIPDNLSFWAGWVVPHDEDIYLVVDDENNVNDYRKALARVGIDHVKGYLSPNFNSWVNRGNDFIDLPQVSVHFLKDLMDANEPMTILDVRSEAEYNSGHIKGAKHIYLGQLPERIRELKNREETIFCVCGGGFRSSIAGSILQAAGFEMVHNVFGGITAWKAAAYATRS